MKKTYVGKRHCKKNWYYELQTIDRIQDVVSNIKLYSPYLGGFHNSKNLPVQIDDNYYKDLVGSEECLV